jgi:hypothetical protein
MKDQHKKIKGYRDLSQDDIDKMNLIKEQGIVLESIIQQLKDVSTYDQTWILDGELTLKKGLMSLVRSVAQPTSF